MKQISILYLFLFAISVGCQEFSNTTVKSYIPGTYARRVQNEFSEGHDTLMITGLESAAYTIEHRMTYRRISEGKPLTEERKIERWTAVYDEKTATLSETKRGRLLTFRPAQNTLLVGGSEYKKIE